VKRSYSLVARRMERQTVKNNTRKSQKDSHIEVVIDWHYTDEASLAFRRLMMLLLKPRDRQPIETARTDEEHQNEQ
jgi:hypothetical protein